MYLKSVTVKGFKSFPDRTRLEFGPGVSVIVGPNGSGKSNVTDAVLWALGEQSPLAVRGQSMQDVIFAGAPGRKAAGSAEVELVLDDSEGVLGLGAPEVSIVRRLDRSGEGEYRIAGARCRLIDVIELLSDTGLGKEMHTVISQGRVEAIVTSKPRDRRLLIEEAAGLGKHRKRRRRAQLKLIRTQDNLGRALDVEREARTRLRPLKRQAEAAELHARLERQSLEARWELAQDDLRERRASLQQAGEAAARARQRREEVERALQVVGEQREAGEQALQRRSAQREELSRRTFRTQSAADRVALRGESVGNAATALKRRLERAEHELGALESEAAAAAPEDEATARLAALEQSLAALERDRERDLEQELTALGEGVQAAVAETQRLEREAQDSRLDRERAETELEQAREGLRAAERGVEAARREAARVGGELAAVNQFLRSHAGLPGGARSLADELTVSPGLELALAAALDGRLRAAVVADRASAQRLLDDARRDGVRALVAGERASAPAGAPATSLATPPTSTAERLIDRIDGSEGALGLARVLLAETWVVEDLGAVPDDFLGVAVTRGGRVWSSRAREVRQAAGGEEERALAERNRRDELIGASEAAVGAELAAAAVLEQAASAVAAAEAGRERAVGEHRAAVRRRDDAAEEERRLRDSLERRRNAPQEGPAAARRAALVVELGAERSAVDRARRERAQREGRISRVRRSIAGYGELLPELAAVQASIAAAGEAIAVQRLAFEAALSADNQAGEHVAAELRRCAQQEAALQAQLHRESEELTGAEVRLQRIRDDAEAAERELAELASALEIEGQPDAQPALSAEEREALRTRIERLGRRRDQLGPVNPLAQEEYAEAVAHVEELERQREDLETALRELERLIADTDRQIRETFQRTFTAAATHFEALAGQLFPGGKGRLRLVADREGGAATLGGAAVGEGVPAEVGDEEGSGEEDLPGVEIEITPGGKEMKRLTLLSGGEKSMTALAFLFSVFLARPCPFYILDEVEAALDDLNIDRFLSLLRQYSERSQFIVVTHQKRTMEAADSLYGVSMGGDGISKVISRRLTSAQAAA